MSDGSGTAATVARLFYSCCGGDADDYQAAEERRRRSAFTSRFKTLLTGLQVQLGAKPKGLHPRDQIFDCILHLYAHEDVDEIIKRLHILYATAPAAAAFYLPQLANFLIHGELEKKERLELFLLDEAESGLRFAHRLWYFLNAWAPGNAYTSELCSSVSDRSAAAAAVPRNPLLRSVEVQGAISAIRFLQAMPQPEQRRQLRYANRSPASAISASSYGSAHASKLDAALVPVRSGTLNGSSATGPAAASANRGAQQQQAPADEATLYDGATAAARATTIVDRTTNGLNLRSVSSSAAHAALLAPPTVSPTLAALLDSTSLSIFFRIRANLAAAASADAARTSWDGSVGEPGSTLGDSAPTVGPTQIQLVLSGSAEDEAQHQAVYGSRADTTPIAPGRPGGGPVMKAVGSPSIRNTGPLMPAGGAASTLAFGAGGMTAFRETIDIFAEFERISCRMATLPVTARNDALRASLAAVARKALPSKTAYVPLGNVHNRLVAIHPDHSFCFKTAKRAPFMVVLEVVDFANANGRNLDADTSEDDDDARDRAKKRREAKGFNDQKMRRAARRARMEDLRARAGQLRGPGGAAAAGEAAVRLVAEGVRDAVDRAGEVGRELGERMQERAHALRSYVLRKVDQLTLEPGQQERASSAGASRRRRNSRRFGRSEATPSGPGARAGSADGGHVDGSGVSGVSSGAEDSQRAGGVTIKNSMRGAGGVGSGASSHAGTRGKADRSTASGRKQLEAVTDGAYAEFAIEEEDDDDGYGGDIASHARGLWLGPGAGQGRQGAHGPEIMSAPPAPGPLGQVDLNSRSVPSARGRFPGGTSGGLPSAATSARRRASSAHSDGSVLDDADAQKLIASEEARLRLQRVVRKLRKSKSKGKDTIDVTSPGQRSALAVSAVGPAAVTGQAAVTGFPAVTGAGANALGVDSEEDIDDDEVDGLLAAAVVLGRDLTQRSARAITQSIRFKPSLRNMARKQEIARARSMQASIHAGINASDTDVEQRALARAVDGAAHLDGQYVGLDASTDDVFDEEHDGDIGFLGVHSDGEATAAARAKYAARRMGKIIRKGAHAVLTPPPLSTSSGPVPVQGRLAHTYPGGGAPGPHSYPMASPQSVFPIGSPSASLPGSAPAAAAVPTPVPLPVPLPPGHAYGLTTPGAPVPQEIEMAALPAISEAERAEMISRMGQWASAPVSSSLDMRTRSPARAGARSVTSPDAVYAQGHFTALPSEPSSSPMHGVHGVSVASGGLLYSPGPMSPLIGVDGSVAGTPSGLGMLTTPGSAVTGDGHASVTGGAGSRPPLVADADLERETAEGLPDYDAMRHELDPDAPGDGTYSVARSTLRQESGTAVGVTSSVRVTGAHNNPLTLAAANADAAVRSLELAEEAAAQAGAGAGGGASGLSDDDEAGDITRASAQAGAAGHTPGTSKEVAVVFPERWREKEARIAASSPYSHLPGWRLMPVLIKAQDDLRQEQFVSQLLNAFNHIWHDARVPVWLKPYDILAISPTAGLIQAVPDTISLDSLKRGDPHFTTLDNWFERHFNWGPRGAERARVARMNFARSLAGYSVACYILQIKDRHNGNILLDRRGHLLHIDFGFLLTNSPGGNIGFEAAPFKLTQEFVQVMGGSRSPLFMTFRKLCVRAFLAVRKYRQRIILLVQMILSGNDHLPCFVGGPRAVMMGLRSRFAESANERQCVTLVHSLIDSSMDNWRTRWYDAYQRWAQNIMA